MDISEPPIQEALVDRELRLTQIWVYWVDALYRHANEGFTGSFDIANGDTVTVVNGKITDVS